MLNTVAPFKSAIRSSKVGMRGFSRPIALPASLMLTHICILPDFLSTTTTGLTHGVDQSTASMVSSRSRRCSSCLRSLQTWKGIRRCSCCFRVTALKIRSLISFSLTGPIPSNK